MRLDLGFGISNESDRLGFEADGEVRQKLLSLRLILEILKF